MAGRKGMKHYPLAMKLEAVGLHEEEGKSYQEITEELGIYDRGRVEKWLRAYRSEGAAAEAGKHTSLYCAVGDGGGLAKKIPCRIAQAGARHAQYRLIHHQKGKYEVKAMCKLFRLSRAAYYA